jgi:hypothetical protein
MADYHTKAVSWDEGIRCSEQPEVLKKELNLYEFDTSDFVDKERADNIVKIIQILVENNFEVFGGVVRDFLINHEYPTDIDCIMPGYKLTLKRCNLYLEELIDAIREVFPDASIETQESNIVKQKFEWSRDKIHYDSFILNTITCKGMVNIKIDVVIRTKYTNRERMGICFDVDELSYRSEYNKQGYQSRVGYLTYQGHRGANQIDGRSTDFITEPTLDSIQKIANVTSIDDIIENIKAKKASFIGMTSYRHALKEALIPLTLTGDRGFDINRYKQDSIMKVFYLMKCVERAQSKIDRGWELDIEIVDVNPESILMVNGNMGYSNPHFISPTITKNFHHISDTFTHLIKAKGVVPVRAYIVDTYADKNIHKLNIWFGCPYCFKFTYDKNSWESMCNAITTETIKTQNLKKGSLVEYSCEHCKLTGQPHIHQIKLSSTPKINIAPVVKTDI